MARKVRRFRSRRSVTTGWIVLVIGVALGIVNYVGELGASIPLPGGHQEVYFLAALGLASTGLWFTGVLDA